MPKHEDFRTTREEEHHRIKQAALQRGNVTERQADEWATQRVNAAMPEVVRMRETEGTSRPTEIRSK
jgi:hypothetical protein